MQNLDDKHQTRSEFEPSTPVFRVTTGQNDPSGPAFQFDIIIDILVSCSQFI